MGSGSGLQDVSFHSGLGLPGVTGREGSGSTSLKGNDVPGTGALAAKIGPFPWVRGETGRLARRASCRPRCRTGFQLEAADERAGDLMAKLDGQGGGHAIETGVMWKGTCLAWPWIGPGSAEIAWAPAWERAATTSLGTDRGPPSTHPTITSLNRSIPTSASLVGPTLCLLSSPRSVILTRRPVDGNDVALLMLDSTGDGPVHGGVAWRVESRDDSDPEPDAVGCRGAHRRSGP